VPALIEILPNEQIHPFVRCSIVRSIGKLGDKTAAPALAEMLSNELNFLLHEAINRAIEALMKKN
jgi:HEAT repeat protein